MDFARGRGPEPGADPGGDAGGAAATPVAATPVAALPSPRRAAGTSDSRPARGRPTVRGPFLFLGEEKLVVRAVTYGTFAPDERGDLYPPRETVRRDFEMMRAANVNTVRTYTPPPNWVLEEARRAGLRVFVGIWWDARDCRFDERRHGRDARRAVRETVARCRDFPDVVLAYSLGNEIPPLTARFHGRRTIYRFMERLYDTAKKEDPDGLVTYGNYPSTEFLDLDFLDFPTINVYLLQQQPFSAYLDRMLIEAKGRPLVLGEVGDDSIRRGTAWQAELLDWTIPLAFDKGVAGVCVYSWTDDWVVGGARVEDWAFGIVDAERRPKPAYDVVRRRFGESPFERGGTWPRVSVVVCNYNGGETLDETLVSLERLDYPDYEVILVEDGSTDDSLEIARRHERRIRVLTHEGNVNLGLSVSRNLGAGSATGEIVAYIDSDAFADRDWLSHLGITMRSGDFAAAGGPNLTPESDGLTAQFIALCPGNPTHVLKDAVRADHIAGVNMAFRREALLAIGGFDPIHTRAGDDVDICWRLQEAGHVIAFSPAAVVWHHRRPSVIRYFRQQAGYGVAENQLERKHPDKFNLAGAIRWAGRVYTAPRRALELFRPFIYHGLLGTALFQTLYQKETSYLEDMPATIHWYVLWTLMFALSPLSIWFLPVGALLLGASVFCAFVAGWATEAPVPLTKGQQRTKVVVVGFVHFMHPIVRSYGRVRARLRTEKPVRDLRRLVWTPIPPVLGEISRLGTRRKELFRFWGVGSAQREEVLRDVKRTLKTRGVGASFSHEWDNHDLEMPQGLGAEGRLFTAPEHYDRALCVGFVARTPRWIFAALASGVVAAAWATAHDWRLAPLCAIPVIVGLRVLESRARLRAETWAAVEEAMARRGAKPFEAHA